MRQMIGLKIKRAVNWGFVCARRCAPEGIRTPNLLIRRCDCSCGKRLTCDVTRVWLLVGSPCD